LAAHHGEDLGRDPLNAADLSGPVVREGLGLRLAHSCSKVNLIARFSIRQKHTARSLQAIFFCVFIVFRALHRNSHLK